MTAKKKNFESINIEPVYRNILEATAEAEPETKQRKERKTYTPEEAAALLEDCRTSGRKGVKLPRINIAFTPKVYDYVKSLSRMQGLTITQFVNNVLAQNMLDNMELYEKVIQFREEQKL